MSNDEKVSAAILCGGKSARFGEDKCFYEYAPLGKPFIEVIFSKLNKRFDEILIVSKNVLKFSDFPCALCKDLFPDIFASLVGIYTSLIFASSSKVFCFACDMPFIDDDLISYFLERHGDYDGVISKIDGKFYPFPGIYSKKMMSVIKRMIDSGDFKILNLLKKFKFLYIENPGFAEKLKNINSKEDLKSL